MQRSQILLLTALLSALSCASDIKDAGDGNRDAGPGELDDPDALQFLSAEAHLQRASMALRGLRPSREERARVRENPSELESIIDAYLESPAFGATMRELHNEAFLSLANLPLNADSLLVGAPTAEMQRSLGEEPLRLIQNVIENDRPYSEIVTADYTMADKTVATAFGLAYQDSGDAWQVSHYTDGRPAAGVLATTAFLMRHKSVGANWHRGRANAASNALLCYDFLDRDVDLDTSIDLGDPDVVKDAVVASPSCASCHQNLDPLASYFWGYQQNFVANGISNRGGYPLVDVFQAEQTDLWQRRSGRPPGYFGYGNGDPAQLGQLVADDPRFSLCAATRFYAFFNQLALEDVPFSMAADMQSRFIESGLSAKALAKAVVMSDEFRASHTSNAIDAEFLVGFKKVRPEQLSRLITELTGFRWRTNSQQTYRGGSMGRVDLLFEDQIGYRVLAGGIDSETVVTPSHSFNATSVLVHENLASEAADFVVTTDFAESEHANRKLLTMVEPSDRQESAVREQLSEMMLTLYGEQYAVDGAEVSASYELFAGSLERSGDTRHAWKTTISALLQDFRIATF